MADSSIDNSVATLDVTPAVVPKGVRLPLTCFLALRYLKPKRTFLSLITLISILGVVLGISVLIIVISVMTGFERELQRKIIGFDAHITISPGPNSFLSNWREAMKVAEKVPGVTGVTPTT